MSVPRKVRDLVRELKKAGFVDRGGHGSHRNFLHPKGVVVTVCGNAGDDAPRYLLRDVRKAIEEVRSR